MSAYDDLMAFQHETEALAQVAARLGWDQETMMPRGAADQRATEMAAIEGVLHERRVDPRIADWLASADAPDEVARAQLREIRRSHDRATRVPARLARKLARVTSLAQGIWAEAREAGDVARFLPMLEQVVALKREEAAALAPDGDAYDALLADYEPGTTGDEIAAIFGRMRPRLVALREAVLGSGYDPAPLAGHFPTDAQLRLSRTLAATFGYDWTRGRMDIAVHPFSSGSGADVRITTRVVEGDPFNCFYSTIHEVGHAAYEQAIDPDYALTPLGQGASMGVHESQSRIYENQIGRGRAFTGWLFGRMQETFGHAGAPDADAFYAAVNRVQPGFIRTEADEVHYNLHIMLRFDLERALMAGDLAPSDLEAAWNDRFLADFGVAVERPADGMLQDVHWSLGLFGYFPTYTLGNLWAGGLFAALREAVPGLDTALAAGDTKPATGWLREHVQRHGGLYPPRDLIAAACGGVGPDEGPLLDYLEAKFGALYGV
ncbi:MAG: carboxypeptidase M32 [Gemmobacter sp.]